MPAICENNLSIALLVLHFELSNGRIVPKGQIGPDGYLDNLLGLAMINFNFVLSKFLLDIPIAIPDNLKP